MTYMKLMKKALFLSTILMMSLASCTSENKPADSPDIRAFGLTGDVSQVYVTTMTLSTTDPEEKPSSEANERLELSFDKAGRVTLDSYSNKYEYDADGKFIMGRTDSTTFTRDSLGRIDTYDNTPDDFETLDFENYLQMKFKYDDKNRVSTVEFGGWEWNTDHKFFYDKDNVYPSKMTFDGGSEGTEYKGESVYEYISFDQKGNWTERKVTSTETESEEFSEEAPKTVNRVLTEKRRIVYYSDSK